jgi:hypothetical protein
MVYVSTYGPETTRLENRVLGLKMHLFIFPCNPSVHKALQTVSFKPCSLSQIQFFSSHTTKSISCGP